MKLTRPLAFIELQASGPKGQPGNIVKHSRITALGIIRVNVDDTQEGEYFRCEGGAQWNESGFFATPFANIADRVRDILEGCDLAGFNLRRFDLPLLAEEFARAGAVGFPAQWTSVVDVQSIFHQKQRRDLAAAVRFYLNEEHTKRHASGDALLTWKVFQKQLERYPELPDNVPDLALFCTNSKHVADFAGLLFWNDQGQLCWNFGKYQHKSVDENEQYLRYFLGDSFPIQSQIIVAEHVGAEWFLNKVQAAIQ